MLDGDDAAAELLIDALIDPSLAVDRRMGDSAHELRVARLTSMNALPPSPSRVNTTYQFKPEMPRAFWFPDLPFFATPSPSPTTAAAIATDSSSAAASEIVTAERPPSPLSSKFVSCGGSGGGGTCVGNDLGDSCCRGACSSGGDSPSGSRRGGLAATVSVAAANATVGADSGRAGGEAEGVSAPVAGTACAGVGTDAGTLSPTRHTCVLPPGELEARAEAQRAIASEMANFTASSGQAMPFAFGEPPEWLVEAAAAGCHTLADIAACTSLEHQGPIDALEQDPMLLAEYNRWLLQASKRCDYLKDRALGMTRDAAVFQQREAHAAHGAALQRAAWRQRGAAVEERQRLVQQRQARARATKREAETRKAEKAWRDHRWHGYARMLHSEVVGSEEEVRHARARLESERVVGARAVKAAHSAIERRKGELQLKRETDARAVRDAVRASSMVHVPPELAATIERSATARGRSGASVLRNPNSVLRQPATERASRKTADWSALGGSCALDA